MFDIPIQDPEFYAFGVTLANGHSVKVEDNEWSICGYKHNFTMNVEHMPMLSSFFRFHRECLIDIKHVRADEVKNEAQTWEQLVGGPGAANVVYQNISMILEFIILEGDYPEEEESLIWNSSGDKICWRFIHGALCWKYYSRLEEFTS